MNLFLDSRYVEIIHRLALGLEPVDAVRGARLSYPLMVMHAETWQGLPRPPIERHDSNLFAWRYQKGVKTPLELLFFDAAERLWHPRRDRRRVVPRRLSISLLTLEEVEEAEQEDLENEGRKSFARRLRHPVFFPGAAYDFIPTATALRGRVVRGGEPMRWARVEARIPGNGTIVGRAHGDDRGEFLLLLSPQAVQGELPEGMELEIEITVFGPASVLAPVPANRPETDPLWDLPLETLSDPGDPDPVAGGEQLPADYTRSVTRNVRFTLGQCLSHEPEFVIT